jgi:FkbH-like protein
LNLLEALELSRKPVADDARPLRIFLACGFTPLHLQTFLGAHLREFFPDAGIEIKTGLYGDIAGSLERLNATGLDGLIAAVEWPDLDPRLGVRSLGGWQVSALPEIISSAQAQLSRLERALITAAHSLPVVLSLPTLPLPPLFYTPSYLGSAEKAELSSSLAQFALALSRERGIRVLDSQALELAAPLNFRFDIKSEVLTGFPYKLPHTSTFARMLASLVSNRIPKKGLITDLDDTMWAGILGEVGVDGINWSLEQHSLVHGLYQQFLSSLASAGVLIGVASKNDPAFVKEAFARKDLLLKKENVFPFEVHWNPKSESVQRILKLWNIGPEAVVFIDDSPMEVAEVQAAFPQMECLVFKKDDYQAVWDTLVALRDRFGKTSISTEDSLRLESLRNAAPLLEALGQSGSASDDFLKRADSLISFGSAKQEKDARALELVNKTNQFNLNGVRLTESDWSRLLADPSSFIVVVSYRDKYGPLGKIAVITGRVLQKSLRLNAWVMSCRAFSRRIEHHCLKYLFEKFNADEIVFDFQTTPRNGPLQDFFVELLGSPPLPGLTISRISFFAKLPPLFHNVEEKENG